MLKKYFMVFGVCLSIILLVSISLILGIKIRNRRLAKWGANEALSQLKSKYPNHTFTLIKQKTFNSFDIGYGWDLSFKDENDVTISLMCEKITDKNHVKRLECDNDFYLTTKYFPIISKKYDELFKKFYGENYQDLKVFGGNVNEDSWSLTSYIYPGRTDNDLTFEEYVNNSENEFTLRVAFMCVDNFDNYAEIMRSILTQVSYRSVNKVEINSYGKSINEKTPCNGSKMLKTYKINYDE